MLVQSLPAVSFLFSFPNTKNTDKQTSLPQPFTSLTTNRFEARQITPQISNFPEYSKIMCTFQKFAILLENDEVKVWNFISKDYSNSFKVLTPEEKSNSVRVSHIEVLGDQILVKKDRYIQRFQHPTTIDTFDLFTGERKGTQIQELSQNYSSSPPFSNFSKEYPFFDTAINELNKSNSVIQKVYSLNELFIIQSFSKTLKTCTLAFWNKETQTQVAKISHIPYSIKNVYMYEDRLVVIGSKFGPQTISLETDILDWDFKKLIPEQAKL